MPACTKHPVGRYWKHFVIILTPLLLLLPLLLVPEDRIPAKANQCLYVMLLMAVYWCTEVLSLAVTACIPIFIFPMLSILTTAVVCTQYLKDIVMMFVGGLMVALAVEKCNLHRRIAISVLHVVGTKPMWLMLGFMLPTWFLSMWISNTATTAMMLPIAEAVLDSLTESKKEQDLEDARGEENEEQECPAEGVLSSGDIPLGAVNPSFHSEETEGVNRNVPTNGELRMRNGGAPLDGTFIVLNGSNEFHPDLQSSKKHKWAEATENLATKSYEADTKEKFTASGIKTTGDPQLDKFSKGMTLSIAYAANSGGIATLTGTGPNTIMKGHADDVWAAYGYPESPVNFATWMVYGFPISCIIFVIVWLWLTLFFNGCRSLCPCASKTSRDEVAIKRVIDREYEKLEKITYAEVMVAVMFASMVLLWFFRSPGFIKGWGDADVFTPGYIGDAVVSIFIAFLLCIIPSKFPTCKKGETGSVDTLLDWHTVQTKLPWDIIFLMGGGFSLAKASTESGLSDWIAEQLSAMSDWPSWAMLIVICVIVAFLTEITSNSATCTILMPITSSMAAAMGTNPLYLMWPVSVTTSFAFMLPVATPPNAIAFSFGRIRIIDMVKAGFILNFICVGVVVMATHTWADAYFDFSTYPWMNDTVTATP